MLSKAIHASAACRAGVQRVHIINGRVDEGLLAEVFSTKESARSFTPMSTSKSAVRSRKTCVTS